MDVIIKTEQVEPQTIQTPNESHLEIQSAINKKGRKGHKKQNGQEDQRQYVCGCGKGYLSYPALYTHIKWKHNGHRLEGTYQPSRDTNGTKGRPTNKKEKQTNISNKGLQEQLYTNETLKNYMNDVAQKNLDSLEEEQDYRAIDDFLLFLSEISPQYILEINAENTDPHKEFPSGDQFEPIAIQLNQMKSNRAYFKDDRFNNEEKSLVLTLNYLFAHFLFCASLHIQQSVYKELAYFVQFLVKDYAKKYGNNKPVQDVLQNHTAIKFIEFSNTVQINDWNNYCKELSENDSFQIVNKNTYNPNEETQNVEYILQFLCQFIIEANYCHNK